MRGIFSGYRFVLIGTFTVWQYEVKELIQQFGGEVVEFVDRTTTYVVVGDKSDQKQKAGYKIAYALSHNIPVITESDLSALMQIGIDRDEQRAAAIQANMTANEEYGVW